MLKKILSTPRALVVLALTGTLYLTGCSDQLIGPGALDTPEDAVGTDHTPSDPAQIDGLARRITDQSSKARHFHMLDQSMTFASLAGAGKTLGATDSVRLVIGFSDPSVSADSILSKFFFKILNRYEYKTALSGVAVTLPASALEAFATGMETDSRIGWFEPDPEVEPGPGATAPAPFSGQEIPWGITDVEGHLSSARSGDGQGAVDVDLYVIDTGVYHPDLNIVECLEFTKTTRGVPCTDPTDPGEHGTSVAGVAAAKDNGEGIVGVAPGARVHAVKTVNAKGKIVLSSVIEAIDFLTKRKLNNPARPMVVNLSLGAVTKTTRYNALDQAVQKSIEAGVVYVIAAGNDGIDAAKVAPAHVTEAITVGAYDQAQRFAAFSNYGAVVDILAPGVDVKTLTSDNRVDVSSGTSIAAPQVAGAVALLLSKNPTLTPAQVQELLLTRSRPVITGMPAGTTNRKLNVRD